MVRGPRATRSGIVVCGFSGSVVQHRNSLNGRVKPLSKYRKNKRRKRWLSGTLIRNLRTTRCIPLRNGSARNVSVIDVPLFAPIIFRTLTRIIKNLEIISVSLARRLGIVTFYNHFNRHHNKSIPLPRIRPAEYLAFMLITVFSFPSDPGLLPVRPTLLVISGDWKFRINKRERSILFLEISLMVMILGSVPRIHVHAQV